MCTARETPLSGLWRFLFAPGAPDASGIDLKSPDLTTRELGKYVRHVIASARTAGAKDHVREIDVYDISRDSQWQHSRVAISKSFDNTIVSDNVKRDFIDDLGVFLSSANSYALKGQPYKRGYVLYGDPGTGKTSIIKAAARHYNIPIYLCNLNNVTTSDFDDLITQMTAHTANTPHMLVFEDVDRTKFFKCKREYSRRHMYDDDDDDESAAAARKQPKDQPVSMNQLLNVFDGIKEPHCRIIIFTANDATKFIKPPKHFQALMRPGRIDRLVRFAQCEKDDILTLYKLFYPQAPSLDPANVKSFKDLSHSKLTEHFMSTADPATARDAMYGIIEWGCDVVHDNDDDAKREPEEVKVKPKRRPRASTPPLNQMGLRRLTSSLCKTERTNERLRELFTKSEDGYITWHNTCVMWLDRLKAKSDTIKAHMEAFKNNTTPALEPKPPKPRGRPPKTTKKARVPDFEFDPEPDEPELASKQPEPTSKPPTSKQPEPTSKQPEPTSKQPEPTGKQPEPTGKQPEPTGKQPEPTGKQPEPTSKQPEPQPGGKHVTQPESRSKKSNRKPWS